MADRFVIAGSRFRWHNPFMPWPSWSESGTAGIVFVLAWLVVGRMPRTRLGDVFRPAAKELAITSLLYSFWRVAKRLPFDVRSGAIERAQTIVDVQHSLGIPSEIHAQRLILAWAPLGWASGAYYAGLHVPATLLFLAWLYIRHQDRFGVWRNRLALTTLFCMLVRFIHVAPPRFLPELGYIDVAAANGMDVYANAGSAAQSVAMPSIHVAWAAIVGFGVLDASPSRWRWLFFAHLPVTMFVVSATGHHWWLDGIVAIALLGLATVIDDRVRRVLQTRSAVGDATVAGAIATTR